MKPTDELVQQIGALRERLSRLSEASLRINESLDFETVLQGVLDSARSLTGAKYGVSTLLDESGRVQTYLTSGLTDDQARRLWELPDPMQIVEVISTSSGPVRLRDFHGYLRSLGLPDYPMRVPASTAMPFLAAPVRHRGECLANFYLAEKDGEREFTPDDEEILVMFASQAALVISNARRYRDEQQARADLETLINTSPVGVAVFDASTGTPVSFNREAVRILEALRIPDRPMGDLLELMTVRRADGREISLQELPFAQFLSIGDTVRAEDIVLSVPDGRSITILANVTPIRSEGGDVVSVVATMQDLTALQELERLRAEFLAMVSHELRAPLTSIKGSAATVLGSPSTLGSTEMIQFFNIIDRQADHMSGLINNLLDMARIETGALSVRPEPVTVATLMDQARDTFLSGGGNHTIRVDLPSDLPWVIADPLRMVQVLGNLLSNAARHSPATAPITMTASHEDYHVAVSVADEGAGLPPERLPYLFRKFSRLEGAERGAVAGGSGLGLAICKGIVQAHGGRIWAESDGPGLGARFTFTIPVVEDARTDAVTRPEKLTARFQPLTGEQERILVVDDDPQVLRYVRDALSKAGYAPVVTDDPQEAPALMAANEPHLVLLDLLLPGTDGIELMKEIRSIANVPVIFLSAYGQEDVIANAFDMGAADYVVKPFSPTELAARIRASLRKRVASEPEPSHPYERGDVTIDYAERSVTRAGRPVRLTAIEYRLLVELSANAGRVLPYDHLLQRVWGLPGNDDLRPMRSAVRSLRRKLGDDAKNPTYIFTEPRFGYRMAKNEGASGQQG